MWPIGTFEENLSPERNCNRGAHRESSLSTIFTRLQPRKYEKVIGGTYFETV